MEERRILEFWLSDLTRADSPTVVVTRNETTIRTLSGGRYVLPSEMTNHLMLLVKVYVTSVLEQKTTEIDELSAGSFTNTIKE